MSIVNGVISILCLYLMSRLHKSRFFGCYSCKKCLVTTRVIYQCKIQYFNTTPNANDCNVIWIQHAHGRQYNSIWLNLRFIHHYACSIEEDFLEYSLINDSTSRYWYSN